MRTPNRELQQYSRNTIGIYLPGSLYSIIFLLYSWGSLFEVPILLPLVDRGWPCQSGWSLRGIMLLLALGMQRPPQTLNPKPLSRNPKPLSLNPKSQTLNPESLKPGHPRPEPEAPMPQLPFFCPKPPSPPAPRPKMNHSSAPSWASRSPTADAASWLSDAGLRV